ncbi:hypothetical protein TCDM_13000 [Trypanosoma cruzi Dm28c]|uniref:Uncharacterized protein n=1 Tax=Trypanosoma cruzi Dm28c TaxID=1416333 RepID=V5A437_TRYCR|nr:hypothetical protein TCDM_13000 [Trypanosoma cruzi Dm28c]
MCILCVVVCACSNTKQRRRKKGAEYVEGRTKMYSGDAWQKQQLEEDHSNSSLQCSPSCGNSHKIYPKQKRMFPSVSYKPHHTK